ncbi:MAG: elongation factor 4 [Candidatus Liptonbacteria bacterium]|nr:elongation factor 4 [Candidatus Liptonbacteria bacterium]
MNQEDIRNFVIIAHIDHGKSTLADRLLELTGTVEARRMKPQYLDQLELERERGITIKMAPVRMSYSLNGESYILNLIDTPGHSDFSYEVSRALAAVEGAILLVDATKGIQAQTLSNFRAARKAGLKIIGAINKIDLNPPRADESAKLLAELIGVAENEIFRISGKTGEGVPMLLEAVVKKVPAPSSKNVFAESPSRSLIFDSLYDDHKGIIAFVRIFDGKFEEGDEIELAAAKSKCKIKELGYFTPQLKPGKEISAGEIGYMATGMKDPSLVKIGDTIFESGPFSRKSERASLPGYREPTPVVFVSLYPDGQTKFEDLKRAFERLHLTDSALIFEPDSSEALGRGLKVGFLGQLHFEIATSRLEREFGLEFLASFPSTAYTVRGGGETRVVKDPNDFPDNPEKVLQPMIDVEIFSPAEFVNQILGLNEKFHIEIIEIKNIGNYVVISARMPLAELMRGFDDKIKSASSGFASFSYEVAGEAPAEVEKLEILVNGDPISALTRIIFKDEAESEARTTVERLKELLPKQQFVQAVQAKVRGRIIARETISAMKKLLGNFGKTGGDRTRKMKLWKKQKEGKKKLKEMSRVVVPTKVFRDLLKK